MNGQGIADFSGVWKTKKCVHFRLICNLVGIFNFYPEKMSWHSLHLLSFLWRIVNRAKKKLINLWCDLKFGLKSVERIMKILFLRFEKLDITPKSAQKIKPVLEQWMKEAKGRYEAIDVLSDDFKFKLEDLRFTQFWTFFIFKV